MKKILTVLVVLAAVALLGAGIALAVQGGELNMSPKSILGMNHIMMYTDTADYGPNCGDCHGVGSGMEPPVVTDAAADMKSKPCFECHPQGGKPDVFITHMRSRDRSIPSYYRCSDCHKIKD